MKLLPIACLLITCFTTCKKYDEDKFAFRTVYGRLEAEWKIEKVEINGSDATSLYNDSLTPLSISDFYFWFLNHDNNSRNLNIKKDLFLINKSSKSYKNAYNNNDVGIGYFGFEEKKKYLITWLDKNQIKDTVSAKIFKNLFERYNYKERYSLESLYHKTLIIQKEKNNQTYRIYFKRTQR